MDKNCNETPDNFAEIAAYVITETEEIVKEIILAEKCYFYDTCAFRNHMMIANPEYIYKYIKKMGGIVIITRCILMEMCSNNNRLWDEHITYIRNMSQYGIKVLVIYEEQVVNVLNTCYSGISQINGMLSFAVRAVKSKTGTIETVLSKNPVLKKELIVFYENQDSSLAERFFREVRMNKASEDNLGEELIAVCVHMLANIREVIRYKYIVLTDDKGAITLLGKTMHNVEQHIERQCISGVTTAKLCWLMVQERILSEKEQVQNIIAAGNAGETIKVYCSGVFELSPNEKTMRTDEFAEKLINHSGMKVYL